MNLPGIPFELILIVLFFVLPALGNLQRRFRGRGGQEGEDPATKRRASPTKTSGAPRAPTQASTQTTRPTTTQPTQASDLPRWLEEAQRRVREAQGEESGRRSARGTERNAQQPRGTGKPLFEPAPKKAQPAARPVQTRPAGSLEGPASEIRSLETLRPAGQRRPSSEDHTAPTRAAPR